MKDLMPLVHTRIKTFGEFFDLCDFFFVNQLRYTTELFTIKSLPHEQLAQILQGIIWRSEELESWNRDAMFQASKDVAKIFGVNHKKIIMPLLFASIMGKKQGPPFFDSIAILGKDRARARLLGAIEFLGGVSNKKLAKLKKAWDNNDCQAVIEK